MIRDLTSPAVMRRWARRWLTAAGNKTAVAVTLGGTSVVITFDRAEGDALYGVNVTPSWLTTVAVFNKTTAGCTVSFGTAAPAGAVFDLSTFRAE